MWEKPVKYNKTKFLSQLYEARLLLFFVCPRIHQTDL